MARSLCVRGSLRAIYAVVCHEQPACQALFVLAAAIGERRFRGLVEKGVDAMQESPMQACAVSHRLAQLGGAHPLPGARNLDVGRVTGAILTQHKSQAGHAFTPDDADLDVALAWPVGNHGGEALVDEVDGCRCAGSRFRAPSIGEDRRARGAVSARRDRRVTSVPERDCRRNCSAFALSQEGKSTKAVSQPPAPGFVGRRYSKRTPGETNDLSIL